MSDDLLRVEEGSLYPALQRLELNGWIEGESGLSANHRRARFYKLTADGRKHLTKESARYRKVTGGSAHDGVRLIKWRALPEICRMRSKTPYPCSGFNDTALRISSREYPAANLRFCPLVMPP